MKTQKIKWLLFHEPAELFIRTAEDFQRHLDELTNNKFQIEILTLEDYQDKYKLLKTLKKSMDPKNILSPKVFFE